MIRVSPFERRRLIVDIHDACDKNQSEMARKVEVSVRTVSTWLKDLTGDGVISGIEQDTLAKLLVAAAKLQLHPELYQAVAPLWDWRRSYRENIARPLDPPPTTGQQPRNHRVPFLGRILASPFGISASVLTSTSMRVRYFAHTCCDVITGKTVRSAAYEGHEVPNVLFTSPKLGVLAPEQPLPAVVSLVDPDDAAAAALGMVNHFGIPSLHPEEWKQFIRDAVAGLPTPSEQIFIQSVVGTSGQEVTRSQLVEDTVATAVRAFETGAHAIEVNGSCPNAEGVEGRLFHDPALAGEIMRELRRAIPSAPLVFKTGFLPFGELQTLVREIAEFADAIALINTMPVRGQKNGIAGTAKKAFSGMEAGLSGEPIRAFGLRAVQDARRIISADGFDHLRIVGIGGVTSVEHVRDYLQAGANVVQATTVFFDDPLFGVRVRSYLDKALEYDELLASDQERLAYFEWRHAYDDLRKTTAITYEMAMSVWGRWHDGHVRAADSGARRSGLGFTRDDFRKSMLAMLGSRR